VEQGEFADREFLDRLQIIGDTKVHVGSALMAINGEPFAGRTVVMELLHATNQCDDEPVTTMFGLDLAALVQLTGSLLYAMASTYGDDEVEHLLGQVGRLRTGEQPDT
jgi:hypothetical protein